MALPKFSRNYTRSGAYENPVTPVDTKTGAIIAQAISNVGDITAKFIERQNQAVSAENAAIKKMLNGINKNATTRREQYSKSLGEHGLAQNEEFARVGTEMIDYLEEQETLLAMSKRNNDSEKVKTIENNIFKTNLAFGKLTQVIKETPDALKTYSEDSLSSNNGMPGGIALSGAGKQNTQYWFGMPAYQGSSADSSSSLIWDKNSDEKTLSMRLNSKEIQENKSLFTEDEEFQGIVVDPLNFLQSDPGRIPDIKTTSIQLLGAKTDENPNGVNLVDKNGQVNDINFYDTSSPKKITRKAGKVYVQYNYNEKALVDRYQKSVTDNLVTPFTTNSDISRINAISNNVFNYEMIPDADAANENGSPFSVGDQTKFQDSTLAYVRGLVPPPKEFVFDEDKYDGVIELTATEREAAKTAKEIAEAAPRVYTDIFKNPESYFKNKKIGGKDVLRVNVSPGSVPADGSEVYPIIELGYKSGTSTADGEQTVFTNDMIFDLSDPTRVRALIDMLPEGADMKKELKKLVGDNPIDSVSIETFEQRPTLPGLSTN